MSLQYSDHFILSSTAARSSVRMEKLYSKVAAKILTESLHLSKGESITIESWNNGLPFARSLVVEARRSGVIPLLVLEDEDAYVKGIKTLDNETKGKMGKQEYALLSGSDAYAFIPGPPLSAYYSTLTAEQRTSATGYNDSWYEAAEKAKIRGVRLSFGYVGREMAKVLGKPVEKIVEHQLKVIAGSDLNNITSSGKRIAQNLQDGSNCTVSSANGSQLEFRLAGDTEIEDGIVDEADLSSGSNMTYLPPGLVSKMVDSSSVSGRVKGFTMTSPFGIIKDGTLEFESGKLAKWDSRPSKKALDKVVASIKEESQEMLQFSIGLNPLVKLGYGIDRFAIGAATLNVSFRLTPVLQKASISVDGKEILSAGKVV